MKAGHNMSVIEAHRIAKAFGRTQAVADVSFAVEPGEVFGLLGPNGAGKTTTIRMILDIFKPDAGAVAILGGPMNEAKKARIGYMPEERGLYQDISLERCLVYLATLKGLSAHEARYRLGPYLERFDLAAQRRKKVKELSKGMQQKAQIISTILHRPEVLIVDEPFAGLDPINTQLVKDVLQELRADGATILMSSHQMHQVEELCDRIVLIDRGRTLLYGRVYDLRRQYAGDTVLLRSRDPLPALPGVEEMTPRNGNSSAGPGREWALRLAPGITAQTILEELVARRVTVERFEVALPTLDEVFIRAVQEGGQG